MFDQLKSLLRRGSSKPHIPTSPTSPATRHDESPKTSPEQTRERLPSLRGLERYQLLAKLGDGAFSNVYKALDLETKNIVAVKAVRKLELSQTQKASVLKEVQLMRTIDHPSIVKLYGFIETVEHYFLILELCEGGELFHRIVKLTYFSEDLSRHCIRQVAEGIRYLHEEKGIVHRDIKPENLLFEPIPFMKRVSPLPPQQPIDGDEPKEDEGEFVHGVGGGGVGQVKICDLGLSKQIWNQQTMTPCGTVGYTAPEIVKDERYSKSVDMWALGCVLYTLLCGFPPFYDENIQTLTEKVARGQYAFLSPWWDTISDGAKDLISHLLCIDPDERYTIDQFFQHPWMAESNKSVDGSETTCTTVTMTTDLDEPLAPAQPRNIPNAVPDENRRKDLYSPGIASMKEMFDVSYAVQRITEEKKARKKVTSRHGWGQILNGNGDGGDDENDQQMLEQRFLRTSVVDSVPQDEHLDIVRTQLERTLCVDTKEPELVPPPSQEDTNKLLAKAAKKSKPVFALSMDHATLLGRRRTRSNVSPLDRDPRE